jgi:AcrR family transcriptional regulator
MEEIAARAGVGKGTVYNLFRSKDELLLSLVAQNFDESRKLIDDSVAAVSEPWAGIRTAWETLMRRVFPELAGRWLLLYQLWGFVARDRGSHLQLRSSIGDPG